MLLALYDAIAGNRLSVGKASAGLLAGLLTDDRRSTPRARAGEHLLAATPGLRPLLGAFSVPDPPVLRPITLYGSGGHLRDGAVLVGDAFSTSCPAGGNG